MSSEDQHYGSPSYGLSCGVYKAALFFQVLHVVGFGNVELEGWLYSWIGYGMLHMASIAKGGQVFVMIVIVLIKIAVIALPSGNWAPIVILS